MKIGSTCSTTCRGASRSSGRTSAGTEPLQVSRGRIFPHSARDIFGLLDNLDIQRIKAIGLSGGGITLLHMRRSSRKELKSRSLLFSTRSATSSVTTSISNGSDFRIHRIHVASTSALLLCTTTRGGRHRSGCLGIDAGRALADRLAAYESGWVSVAGGEAPTCLRPVSLNKRRPVICFKASVCENAIVASRRKHTLLVHVKRLPVSFT